MRRIFTALIVVACHFSAFAKDKVNISAEPSWLYPSKIDNSRKADLKEISNGYYFELYDSQMNLINNTEYLHYVRHIVNETGVQNGSEVSVNFSPEYQTLIFHKVCVIRNGQVINQLATNDIKVVNFERESDNFLYNGIKRAFILLKDVRKNDRIEVSYSLVGFNPVYKNRFSSSLYFSHYSPTSNYFETIIAQPGRKLYFTYYSNAPHPTEEDVAGAHIYHWNNPESKKYEYSEGAPVWYRNYPYVTVSEFANWSEVVTWAIATFNNYSYDLPKGLLNKIHEWRNAANGDDDEFIKLALRYVQDDVRYLGLEIGVHTYKPHDPADVYKKGYGDCKDKALLLCMILKHENIDAFVALLNTERKAELLKDAPGSNQFNHAIVAIERNNSLLYVDPTMSMQKGNLKQNFIPDYGYVLLIRENENHLTRMTPGTVNSVDIVETMSIDYHDTSTLEVRSQYKGGKAESVRSDFASIGMTDLKESYVKYYSPLYKDILMDGDIGYEDDTSINSIVVTEKYKIPNIWSEAGKKKSFDVYAKALHEDMGIEPPADASYPLALKYPVETAYTLHMNMPGDWSVKEKKIHIVNGSYQFDFESVVAGNKIKFTYHYKTFKDHIPVAELAQYREDYKKISDVIEYEMSYTDLNKVTDKLSDNISWTAIWITAAGFFLMSVLLVRLNRSTIDVEYDRDSGWKIGGWMVVLGISLCLHLLGNFINLFYGDYFKDNTWIVLKESGDGLYAVGIVEMVYNVLRLSMCVAVVIWFFKRRDIFPKMFLYYIGLVLVTQLGLYLHYNFIDLPDTFGDLRNKSLKAFFQSVVYAAIWCTYVIRAYRTKATFLKAG